MSDLIESNALRRLYFRQIEEHATKIPTETPKNSYLDRAHLLPDVKPYGSSRNRHLNDKLGQKTYLSPSSDSGLYKSLVSKGDALYTAVTSPRSSYGTSTSIYNPREIEKVLAYQN